jgi:hypothetical protein
MSIDELLNKLKNTPESINFQEVITVVDENYFFTPTAFKNGSTYNEAGQNNGSCKLFAFAQLQNLSKEETLNCFGDYYRKDVLGFPDNTDHQNIRNFISFAWDGIKFDGSALEVK